MESPRVSVVVPAYQCERTLGGAISSALTQTYPDVEVVVCIDGATDRSRAIAEAYGDLVRVVTQPNAGPSAARNTAIAHAGGEYIALLDSDDILLPHFVDRCLDRLRTAGATRGFVACNALKMSRHGLVEPVLDRSRNDPSAQRMLMLERNIATGHALFPKEMWTELGGFDTELRTLEDWDFWTRALFSGWALHLVHEPTAIYRLTPGSLSSQDDLMESHFVAMRRHVLDTVGDRMSPEEREYVELTIRHPSASRLIRFAGEALAEGDRQRAAALLRDASLVAPSDRRLRLKQVLVERSAPAARVYRWREQRRLTAQQR